MALLTVYLANVLVAGSVGVLSLFAPGLASRLVFSGTAAASSAMQITGALWLAIALLSIAGLVRPMTFVPVLVIQLVYKASWLLVVAAPAYASGRGDSIPGGIAGFFLVWALVLPFVIPWSALLRVE